MKPTIYKRSRDCLIMLKSVETSDQIKWPSFEILRLQRYLANIVVTAVIIIGCQ